MSSQDDPEARIRDLERSLSAQSSELTQTTSELGPATHGGDDQPPPPAYAGPPGPYSAPPPTYPFPQQQYGAPFPTVTMAPTGGAGRGWVVYGVMAAVLVTIIGGTVIFFANAFSGVNSVIDTFNGTPSASGGGGGGPFGAPPSRSGGNRPPTPAIAPSPTPGPIGGDVSVAGVGEDKSIACNDSVVNVSGVSNTIVITGNCASVSVSGVENTVTVESSATISASGMKNRVTYLTGAPEISNSGDSNVVEHG